MEILWAERVTSVHGSPGIGQNTSLAGIRALDVTGMGAASVTAMMLGDIGADVLKIDMPPGISNRGLAWA